MFHFGDIFEAIKSLPFAIFVDFFFRLFSILFVPFSHSSRLLVNFFSSLAVLYALFFGSLVCLA